MRPELNYADSPLGRLHYAELGDGFPLLMLHQTPRSHDEFAEVQPLMARSGYRAIAMDMLGFGLSAPSAVPRSEEHTSELQSRFDLVCRLLLEKKKIHTMSTLIPVLHFNFQ